MLGFATIAMLCKVGHAAVSMLFPTLLKLKRKWTELLLRDAITLSFGRSWRFAWSLATAPHGICSSNIEKANIRGMNQTYPACLRPNVCPSHCLSHPNNNEVTIYPHNFPEFSLHWINNFFLCVGPTRRVLKTIEKADFSSVVSLSSSFLRDDVSLHCKVLLHPFGLGLENDHFCCDYQMFWGSGLNALRIESS